MRKQDTPHISQRVDSQSLLTNDAKQRLSVLKYSLRFLNANLSDKEKEDAVISAQLEAISQKISKLETMIKEFGESCEKCSTEIQSLMDSFKKDES